MTATAQFPASYVYERAAARIVDMERAAVDKIEEAVQAAMLTPVTTGALWWKRSHYRTRAEAEAWVNKSEALRGSIAYWAAWTPRQTARALRPLERLSAAAIQANVKFVTLTPDDCSYLDIPLKEAA